MRGLRGCMDCNDDDSTGKSQVLAAGDRAELMLQKQCAVRWRDAADEALK